MATRTASARGERLRDDRRLFRSRAASGELGTAADLNEVVQSYCVQHGIDAPTFDDSDVARVRQARGALFQRWDALSSGEALELSFEQK